MNKYSEFGKLLQSLRLNEGESITDTAKKLGCDRSYLSKLENGHERPSVEFLNEIIRHFNLSGEESMSLARLAKLTRQESQIIVSSNGKEEIMEETSGLPTATQLRVDIPQNMPALYTDSVFINSNQHGFVFNFGQVLGPKNQQIVARIGMSREHAKSLLIALERNLSQSRTNKER